jgi:centromeric protein E
MSGTPAEPGVIPLSVVSLFQRLAAAADTRAFTVRIAYMEIYNEVVNDLLDPAGTNLSVQEDPIRGVVIIGLKEEVVDDASTVLQRLQQAERQRHVGRTNMNEVSSRSHAVFRMVIENAPRDLLDADAGAASDSLSPAAAAAAAAGMDHAVLVSSLYLVDLAGSERSSKAGGGVDTLREASAINRSLLTLGKIINKLSQGGVAQHLPYRESKLTRILRPSLDGNARVAVVATAAPAAVHYEETCSTLMFATRAKLVRTRARVNEARSQPIGETEKECVVVMTD